MSDYISRQAAIDAVNRALDRETLLYSFVRKVVISVLKRLPAADVVPVVRCRNCARLNRNGYCTRFQNNISGIATSWFMPDDDDFCSCGERREG